jgi:hypothetical protein
MGGYWKPRFPRPANRHIYVNAYFARNLRGTCVFINCVEKVTHGIQREQLIEVGYLFVADYYNCPVVNRYAY